MNEPYFTVADLRARYTDLNAKTDAELEAALLDAEEAIEDAADVAFVRRQRTQSFTGDGSFYFRADRPQIRLVVACTIDGLAVELPTIFGKWWLRRAVGWPTNANVAVAYQHGYDAPPRQIRRAAMILTHEWALRGPVDQRATQIPTGDGGAINLATPGLLGSIFGLPEVDVAVKQYREPPPVGGIG